MIYRKYHRKKSGFNLLAFLFTLFCFFPYIKILPFSTDSQPNAMVLAMIIIIFSGNYKLKSEFTTLGLVFIFSLIGLLFDHDWNAMRSVANYLSIFMIPYATFDILKKHGVSYALWKTAIVIWGGIGLVQLIVDPQFGSFLLPRHQDVIGRLETGRGVVSLAPEPTFYGIMCLLLMCVGYLNFNHEHRYKIWMLVLLTQFLFLSRSSTCIFVLLLGLATYYLILGLRKSPKIFVGSIVGFVLAIILIRALEPYIAEFRAGHHLLMVLNDPTQFMIMDPSVNERFIHAFFPIYGFFQNFGLPHFYNEFNDYMRHIYYSWEFSDYIIFFRNNARIMSGVGCSLYELGIVGGLIWYVLFKDIIRISKRDSVLLLVGLVYFYIMLNAMPLTNAMVGYVLGNIIYRRYYPLTK